MAWRAVDKWWRKVDIGSRDFQTRVLKWIYSKYLADFFHFCRTKQQFSFRTKGRFPNTITADCVFLLHKIECRWHLVRGLHQSVYNRGNRITEFNHALQSRGGQLYLPLQLTRVYILIRHHLASFFLPSPWNLRDVNRSSPCHRGLWTDWHCFL